MLKSILAQRNYSANLSLFGAATNSLQFVFRLLVLRTEIFADWMYALRGSARSLSLRISELFWIESSMSCKSFSTTHFEYC
jgi:hypothetical protein